MGTIIEITFVTILIIIIIANLIASNYQKEYRQMHNEVNLSGFEIAKLITNKFCDEEPHIIKKKTWRFLDYYNFNRHVIKLNPEVFDETNMLATFIAITTSTELIDDNKKIDIIHKLGSFLLLGFYLLIIIGALLNNYSLINLSLIIFIISFLIEISYIIKFINNNMTSVQLTDLLNKEKILEPKEMLNNFKNFCFIIKIASFPYNFINYFN